MSKPTPQSAASGRTPVRPLASAMLAAGDWLVASARKHPLAADAMLAAAVLVVSVPPFTDLGGVSRLLSLGLVVAMICPLIWRRRVPFLVMAIITALAYVELFTRQQLTDYLALLVAFYTVAVYSSRGRVLAAAAALEAGAVLAVLRMRSAGGHDALVLALATGLVAVAGLLGFYVRATRRAHLVSLAERAEQAEREREQQAELAASAERARIAREMHDIVAHNIAVMIALADGAAYTAGADPVQAVNLMGQVSNTGRTALAEMRRLLGVLRQPAVAGYAPQPGLANLDDLLTTVRAAGQAADLAITGQPFPLPPSAQLAIYRMVQEALTNTLKHARASRVGVDLHFTGDALAIAVRDDGRGNGGGGGTGSGLIGMHERVVTYGGTLQAGPAPGGGFAVEARFPLEDVA
jgi:signal transduction histidine kinase